MAGHCRLAAAPDIGAVTLALLFGLFSMIYGVSEILVGVQLRQARSTLRPLERDAV